MELVTAFFDSYLELTAEEERLLERKSYRRSWPGRRWNQSWKSQRHGIGRAGRKVFNRVFGRAGRSYCSSY
jgi:hypothetical protein